MSTDGPLAVLGAINVDLVVAGTTLPRAGETTTGGAFETHQGGKGGNQAVAAARAGAPVVLVGAVGADAYGAAALEALNSEGVDCSRVRTVPDAATGVALIVVSRRGENQIAVALGANASLENPNETLDAIGPSLVLASCEIPYKGVSAASKWCKEHGVPFVMNPAPAALRLRNLLDRTTVLTPNRVEVMSLTAAETTPIGAAHALRRRNPDLAVVITLGEDGAVIVDPSGETFVDAPFVEAVDATGAGDCFNGVLAAGLHAGLALPDAARRASVAATLSVQVAGAREGMPTGAQIDAAMPV
ncbi:MAG: ribokinase [Actinomycetota bacterium]